MNDNNETTDYIAYSATYSAEDNKLRLYFSERLDSDLYLRVRDAGFVWAPKQALFVAPKWTPSREDLCIELAGEIEAEESTMIERAEAKAERLDNLAVKRAGQATGFHAAANAISERFAYGQPILVGHHSERKARKDKDRMTSAMDNAIKAQQAVNYWNYRAEGVERHANYKSKPAVRARRIKTLLTDLRTYQRRINHAFLCLKTWQKIEAMTDAELKTRQVDFYIGAYTNDGGYTPYYSQGDSLRQQLDKETITEAEAIEKCIDFQARQSESPYVYRWISHILNRLAFERSELGMVARFSDELTSVILQKFLRDHGTEKPKVKKTKGGFKAEALTPFPLHIANGQQVEMSTDEWLELMVSVGYEVPIAKPRRTSTKVNVSLINPDLEEAQRLQKIWNDLALASKSAQNTYGRIELIDVKQFKQATYSANSKGSYTLFETIEIDSNGKKVQMQWQGMQRVKSGEAVCRIRVMTGCGSIYSADSIINISDKPVKELPIDWDSAEASKVEAA